ncbi:MAG: hypothetical protein HYS87_03240 [Candidatus Colwellbacteria bacterium]|nr:hypothetical protein [Candidatus Colwellbacteria bacterium]
MNLEQQRFIDLIAKERKDAIRLRNDLNKDFKDTQIKIAEQKWGFFKHVTILSGAVLGLSSIIDIPNNNYFFIGLVLNIIVIIFNLLIVREKLDNESNNLQKMQDEYNLALEERLNLLDEYFGRIGRGEKFDNSYEATKEYFQRLSNLASTDKLREENKKLSEERKSRFKKAMDYSGEISLFLFVLASYFMVTAVFGLQPSQLLNIVIIVFISLITLFFDSASKLSRFISVIIHYIKNI